MEREQSGTSCWPVEPSIGCVKECSVVRSEVKDQSQLSMRADDLRDSCAVKVKVSKERRADTVGVGRSSRKEENGKISGVWGRPADCQPAFIP